MDEIVQEIIPAYPFVQYNDDENVVAFFKAYNGIAQEYLDALNKLHLPCWTSPEITGWLLDWIAHGIYGQLRPALSVTEGQAQRGDYNSVEYNASPYAHISNYIAGKYEFISDDMFKRVLTWNFYKYEGFQFSVPWFKRRIARFIHGKDGIDPVLQHTFDVSVKPVEGGFSVIIPDYGDGIADSLKSAIEQGFCKTPFMYNFIISTEVH